MSELHDDEIEVIDFEPVYRNQTRLLLSLSVAARLSSGVQRSRAALGVVCVNRTIGSG